MTGWIVVLVLFVALLYFALYVEGERIDRLEDAVFFPTPTPVAERGE